MVARPRPTPIQTSTKSSSPRAAPTARSAIAARFTSFSIVTGRPRSLRSASSTPSCQAGRLTASRGSPVTGSSTPGVPITTARSTSGDTPAAQGALANITSDVHSWSNGSGIIPGNLANDTIGGSVFAVPWFGGVRGIWYRKDEFAKAGISSPPATWAQLVSDAKLLMKKYPGTYGLGAPSNYTNAIVSFIWGAGGQVAVQNNGQWTAELTSPQSEAGIKFYADLLLTQHVSPAKYVGQTELGAPGATSGGSNQDFAKGTLGMYIDGPWAKASLTAVSKQHEAQWASFPIPSQNGPNPAPAFAGGSDLGVWAKSPNSAAAWDLVSVMDNPVNATTFANAQGFFPEFTAQLSSGKYAGDPAGQPSPAPRPAGACLRREGPGGWPALRPRSSGAASWRRTCCCCPP